VDDIYRRSSDNVSWTHFLLVETLCWK